MSRVHVGKRPRACCCAVRAGRLCGTMEGEGCLLGCALHDGWGLGACDYEGDGGLRG